MTRLLFLALTLSVCFAASAQQPTTSPDKPTPPVGPLVGNAPEFSQWEISYQYPDDQRRKDVAASQKVALPSDPRPRKVVTTKTGKIIHESQVDGNGKQLDRWFDGGIQYTKHSGQTVWFQADDRITNGHRGDLDANPLPASGFRDLDWIDASAYIGTVPYGNGNCLVFVPGGGVKLDTNDPEKQKRTLETQSTIAYIDSDSRLPVAVRLRSDLMTFHFNPPPNAVQSLPQDLAGQIKKGEEGRAHLEQRASRPY